MWRIIGGWKRRISYTARETSRESDVLATLLCSLGYVDTYLICFQRSNWRLTMWWIEIVSKFLFSLHVVNVSIIWLTSPLDFISAINLSFDHVVKVTILMRDINSYAEVNRAYEKFFPNKRYPARACYAVKDLPLTAKLEIEAIAASGNNIIYDWRNVLIPLIVGTALMKSSE